MANILVTGGNGYIGSHTVHALQQAGHTVEIFDWNRKNNKLCRDDINGDLCGGFYNNPDVVVHLAAKIEVNESLKDPLKYWTTNLGGTLNLLNAMEKYGTNKIVFASSAAVYGNSEFGALEPTNPYGETKLQCERILYLLYKKKKISAVCLRYFNVSGASPDLGLGEKHDPETHLIPNIINTLLGKKEVFELKGSLDIRRDFVHVKDVANSNVLAVNKLLGIDRFYSCENVCSGKGTSIGEIIEKLEKISGKKLKLKHMNKKGGAPCLIGNPYMFEISTHTIDQILESAYEFHKNCP